MSVYIYIYMYIYIYCTVLIVLCQYRLGANCIESLCEHPFFDENLHMGSIE